MVFKEFVSKINLLSPKISKEQSKEQPDDNLELIYAFRTISTMLRLIQCGTELDFKPEITDTDLSDETQRKELRILDALSSVIVRRHEIAAVVVTIDSGTIEVLVSYIKPSNKIKLITPQRNGVISSILKYLVTPNPRDPSAKGNAGDPRDSMTTVRTKLAVVDPEFEGANKDSDPKDLLETYLREHW
jgi:hypothetical protein